MGFSHLRGIGISMKDRITLLIIFVGLAVILYIYQYHFNTIWGLVSLVGAMFVYSIYMVVADKHRKRKLRKNPQVINENYKPFVTIMVPAHNEASVIADTVENILQIDYPNYELIIIDDRSEENEKKTSHDLSLMVIICCVPVPVNILTATSGKRSVNLRTAFAISPSMPGTEEIESVPTSPLLICSICCSASSIPESSSFACL